MRHLCLYIYKIYLLPILLPVFGKVNNFLCTFNFYRDMILMCLHIYRTITIQEEKNMGGFFGVASKEDCVFDLFFGTD